MLVVGGGYACVCVRCRDQDGGVQIVEVMEDRKEEKVEAANDRR